MMIKPKGRPSSQCKHCKDLRKNKNSHPSGACTCGKNKKISTSSNGSVAKCTCKTGDPCTCHGRRKRTDSKSNLSKISSNDASSSFSPQPESASSLNLPTSSSLNWTNSSISLSQAQQQQQQQNGRIRQIGMDPLANAKPAGQTTRTRVGEVSVPINEYIPNNSNGIGNVNDKMPDVFFQDVPLPFEPGHGLLDLFANNNLTSVNPYFHENPTTEHMQHHQQQQMKAQQQQQENGKMFSPTSTSTNSDNMMGVSNNNIRSPSDASNQFTGTLFSTFSNSSNGGHNKHNNSTNQIGSPESKVSNGGFPRNDSVMSLSSVESNSQISQMSRINGSSDSLTSANYHHYDNMIHKSTGQKFTFPNSNNNTNNTNSQTYGNNNNDINNNNTSNNNNDDAASIQSVEVLSLTPSFMDIPTDFKNEKGYFLNNHNNDPQPQQSNESFKSHRFTPSVDSIQSAASSFHNKSQDHQTTIPQIHSNLINDNTTNMGPDEDVENMVTPRETSNGSHNNGDGTNFMDGSMFNNFNTKLTTSGL